VNFTVEHLGPCKKLLKFDVPAEAVDASFEEVADQYRRQAQLPGFRPGRSPKHLILKSFGPRIERESRHQLVGKHFDAAVKQEKFRVIGEPIIEDIQFEKGKPFQFAATIEIVPEFELPEYKGIEVKRETRIVTDADIERALNVLRDERAAFEDVERPVQDGDFVVVDYQGTSEGKPLTEFAPTARGLTEKKDFWMYVAKDSFIPGFTEQLIGANIGETRSVSVQFPEDFVSKPLSGKKGDYQVTLRGVKVKKLPSLDDEFAKQFGAEDLLKLRDGVRADLENEAAYKRKQLVRDQLVGHLLSRVEFELPEAVVQATTKSVVYDIVKENQERGLSKDALDQQKNEIYNFANKSAKERVKTAFILGRIAEKESIKATDEEITHRILMMARQNGIKPERLVKQLQERDAITEIRQQIANSKVLDFLELNAKVEELLPSISTGEATPPA